MKDDYPKELVLVYFTAVLGYVLNNWLLDMTWTLICMMHILFGLLLGIWNWKSDKKINE
jgi:hypothetical protein